VFDVRLEESTLRVAASWSSPKIFDVRPEMSALRVVPSRNL
jgi:hypothetical protein